MSDDGSLAIWNLTDGTLVKRIQSPVVKSLDVDVSPDGRLAAVARWDETVRLYDLENTTEVRTLQGHRGNVNAVAFAADSLSYTAPSCIWQITKSSKKKRSVQLRFTSRLQNL